MGMPVTVEIAEQCSGPDLVRIFNFFRAVDQRFSTYKPDSEISRFNAGEISEQDFSPEMREIFMLAEETKRQTSGYFDMVNGGKTDPSGIVKGWAILKAAELLAQAGFKNHYVEAGGDIQLAGKNKEGRPWKIGIRNPFNDQEIVKILELTDCGIATSGTYVRGQHIYNPKNGQPVSEIASLTVIGPDIYEADRFATAAFAMGREGINFIEKLPGFAGYMIDNSGVATLTTNFEKLQ